MNPALAKITAATETLPDYAREEVENDLIAQAEASAKAWATEAERRDAETMQGLKELENGEGMTIDEWRVHLDGLKANLRKRATR